MIIKHCSQLNQEKPMHTKQKDLISKKEETKCNNIIKINKND